MLHIKALIFAISLLTICAGYSSFSASAEPSFPYAQATAADELAAHAGTPKKSSFLIPAPSLRDMRQLRTLEMVASCKRTGGQCHSDPDCCSHNCEYYGKDAKGYDVGKCVSSGSPHQPDPR